MKYASAELRYLFITGGPAVVTGRLAPSWSTWPPNQNKVRALILSRQAVISMMQTLTDSSSSFKNCYDKVVLKKITAVLYPKSLTDGMDYLKSKIDDLSESLLAKDVRIADLENKAENLENKLYGYEQYSCRSNLRFLSFWELSVRHSN